jgi:glycerol-3-phosphate dehydrogenase
MAEDTVNLAAKGAGLPARDCRTSKLGITSSSAGDGKLLHPKLPYREGDVIRAAREEMARSVADVLARRTRALYLDARAAIECAPRVAALLTVELGRSKEWHEQQIADFQKVAEAHLP